MIIVLRSLFEPPADEPFEATSVEGEVRLLKGREACASGRIEVISSLTLDRTSAQQGILPVLHALMCPVKIVLYFRPLEVLLQLVRISATPPCSASICHVDEMPPG